MSMTLSSLFLIILSLTFDCPIGIVLTCRHGGDG
jgi:hypothetical protein